MKREVIDFTSLDVGEESFRRCRIIYCSKCGRRGEFKLLSSGAALTHRLAKCEEGGVVFYETEEQCYFTGEELEEYAAADSRLAGFVRLDMPAPPFLESAFGYEPPAPNEFYPYCRFVAFFWWGSKLAYADGQSQANTSWHAWLTLIHHPAFWQISRAYDFGSDDGPAAHWLLLDRLSRAMYVGRAAEVEKFLRETQGPKSPELSAEENKAILRDLQKHFRELLSEFMVIELTPEMIEELNKARAREFELCEQLRFWLNDYLLHMGEGRFHVHLNVAPLKRVVDDAGQAR